MNSPASPDPESAPAQTSDQPEAVLHHGHPDPLTGEPDAHPIGVGVGAIVAGAIGAGAVGAIAGPVGVVIGAAIGAIAGGLAGKEVAESPEVSPTLEEAAPLDEFERTGADAAPARADLADKSALAAQHGSEPALDEFDRPHPSTQPTATTAFDDAADRPLPTASSGLITPDESSFFADSDSSGGSSMLTKHPLPAAQAVSPGDRFADETEAPLADSQLDVEQTIRTGAYYRYLDRQTVGQPGSDFDDWIAAEREVLHR